MQTHPFPNANSAPDNAPARDDAGEWTIPIVCASAVIGWCWLAAAIVEMVAPV